MVTAEVAPRDRIDTLPSGIPDITLGWEGIYWATKYLRQPDGPKAGERWEFTESQVRFILWWYSLTPAGRWNFFHGVRRLPKGAGKSPFAAVLALIELLAPVRLKQFHPDAYGGCIGRRVGMPLVQIAATSHDQANVNTMRMVRALLPEKSRIRNDYDIETGKTIFYVPGGGQLMVVTSSPTTEEGALVTFGVLDQTETWLPTNGGIDMAEVMDRNVGKQGNRLLETSNAWEPGLDSVAEQTFEAWIAQEEGRLRGTGRILYDARMAPPDTDFEDTDSLVRGVKYAYGDAWWVDPEDIVMNRILSPRTPLDVSKRFYLNWPEAAEDAWTTQQQWATMAKPDFHMEDGSDIVLGFDGSRVDDATALIGCHVETGFVFAIGIWETLDARGNHVPIPAAEVDAAVAMAFERWNVISFLADVKEWEESTKIAWRQLYEDKLLIWAVPGGKDPQPIAWDMRSHTAEFTFAAEMVEQEIASAGFSHDGDSRLGRHVINSRRRPNRWGISIGKEAPKSPRKIDGAVAMVISRHARRLVLGSKIYQEYREQKTKPAGKRVWSFS
jgi:hypothetical protein